MKNIALMFASLLFVGCASVPTVDDRTAAKAKRFSSPPPGQSGIYIYRPKSAFGAALKKDIWINRKCIGESAPGVFFHQLVKGNAQHKLSTESEFSANDLYIDTVAGRNYFVKQSIKMGLTVGGAKLRQVSPEKGKAAIRQLDMAIRGHCGSGAVR